MNKIKKLLKSRAFPIIIAVLVLLLAIIIVTPSLYDALIYRDKFYIGYAQYPGDTIYYRTYSPDMKHRESATYEGLEFIGWYYLDENGNEKEFVPTEFTPPENAEKNYLNVYGRWKSVKPEKKD